MMPKHNKYYIDASVYSDADSVARQVQSAFPKVRFGVGPAALNANFDGDEGQIVAYLANIPPLRGPNHPLKSADPKRLAPDTPPRPREVTIQFKEGDAVLVPSLDIEAKIKKELPQGIVHVELADGILETMLAKNLEPAPPAAPQSANPPPPPAPPNAAPPPPANVQRDAPAAPGGEP
ncbi:MAG TPA: hypothetical protein PK156_16105 [Polyangium sp.]|nr:hypothetical protein [Polyangium sp.]